MGQGQIPGAWYSLHSSTLNHSLLTMHAAKFLFNNFEQALTIIKTYTSEVEAFKVQLRITSDNIEGWVHVEQKFLEELKEEPVMDIGYFSYFLSLYLPDKETQRNTYLNPCSKFILNFLDIIYSQMTPIRKQSFLLKLEPLLEPLPFRLCLIQ